ncbi:MAG: PP2C family protein-serine/threonine phosphatase [Acidobacteriia bacterium]|nr:PP2C family protein-serine/threonine phosphatase [Terriglobia bacterium]
MLRGQVAEIIIGSVFVFIGLTACCIAAIRRRSGMRIFFWLGIWSAMYGAEHLGESPAVVAVSPRWLQISAPYANTAMTYLAVVVGSLSFLELSLGKMRFLNQAGAFVGLAIAVAGIGFFVLTGSNDKLMLYNNLLEVCLLLVLMTVVAVPRLSRKYLVLPDRGVLATGMLVFTIEALYANLSRNLGFATPRLLDHLGFAILLFSFGYVALQLVFRNERRLLSVENELAIAREIQTSILPGCVPEINNLSISAAYRPMTAVAGDFYEFIPIDQKRVGILVADVSGHGVPAALISSMIKVAMQSVVTFADDPAQVLRGLNRILSTELRGHLTSAAYLWIDTESQSARYSAAGHPPLLFWRNTRSELQRIESNGLLFGVTNDSEFPVRNLAIESRDRFLMYTDGMVEPEGARGESFGDRQLEQVVRNNRSQPASELSRQLLSELQNWQRASMTQQDDITLIVIDVL